MAIEEWEHWWWDWAGDPQLRPTLEVHTARPKRMPKPRVKDGKPLVRYVHRFGFQPKPVKVFPPKLRIKAKAPRA